MKKKRKEGRNEGKSCISYPFSTEWMRLVMRELCR